MRCGNLARVTSIAADLSIQTVSTGIAGMGLVASYVLCLPFLIVGLLLVRKKNVWQCGVCSYSFERG